ncbi:hypothetical protein C818_00845 [Lachnospiraceae bacterium MD308]|nr:hypothetical protein C818_00845 [Lachnospiraceae bacterium MD308]
MIKKKLAVLLVTVLLSTTIAPAVPATAQESVNSEAEMSEQNEDDIRDESSIHSVQTRAAGNSMSSATGISTGTTYNGSLTDSNTIDYYKFSIGSSGRITLTASAGMAYIYYYIYDSSGNQIWYINPHWDNTTQTISTNEAIDLTKGTYYYTVKRDGSGTGNYSFKLSFSSAEESFTETGDGTDNLMSSANEINVNTDYKGQIADNDDRDFYRFVLTSSGRITFTATAGMVYINYYIYDSAGEEIWRINPYWNSATEIISTDETIDLTKGTYYFAVRRDGGSNTGNYSFRLQFSGANESFPEAEGGTDNSITDANDISLNKEYRGQIARNDDRDFYEFTVNSSDSISVVSEAHMPYLYYYIYDSAGKEVWRKSSYRNSTTKKINIAEEVELTAGTYYLAVEGSRDATGPYSFGIYRYMSISPASVSLSVKSYVYDGLAKKPDVTVKLGSMMLKKGTDYTVSYSSNKNVGDGKVTVIGKGTYNGSVIKTFTIKPKGTSLSKLTSKSKGFKIKWKKQEVQTSGYQIQYATKSSFSNKRTKTITSRTKTTITLKNLKAKKKYYVRIRTYKMVSGKKLYSAWSGVKKVKTRK